MIHNFAYPTMNQSFLSIIVILTLDEFNEFLISLAAARPPNPPPKITTCGIFDNYFSWVVGLIKISLTLTCEGESTAYKIAFAISCACKVSIFLPFSTNC